jgi:hypothetical protein
MELRSVSAAGVATGSWTGPDGVSHPMASQNLMTDSSWFFPALTIAKLLASTNSVVALVGQEARGGTAVEHVTAVQQTPGLVADVAAETQRLTEMDFYLDASTLLPVALDFNIHPDDNMLLDIPVEIRFSDYRSVGGVQIPFHVQKYLNNVLLFDTQLQSATLNSGLSASAFNIP